MRLRLVALSVHHPLSPNTANTFRRFLMSRAEERFSHVTFLGTASAVPCPGKRNVSGMAITTLGGESFLVDCGEGTQHQITQCSSVKADRISHIFLTHLHGDHCFGIFGLLASMAMSGREKKVVIFAPKGIRNMVETVYGCGDSQLFEPEAGNFPIEFKELEGKENIDLGKIGSGFHVTAHPLKHRVPTFGYSFSEPERVGKLDAAKAKARGAKGKMLGRLKSGYDVQLPDGTTICSADVVQPSTPGRKITILQDTCDSQSAVERAMGSDLLIHEATYDHSMVEKAIEWGHSTAKMAGEYAAAVKARTLALTHFSSRYHSGETSSKGKEKDPQKSVLNLVEEAQAQCPQTRVIEAKDFLVVRSSPTGFIPDEELSLKKKYLALAATSREPDEVMSGASVASDNINVTEDSSESRAQSKRRRCS